MTAAERGGGEWPMPMPPSFSCASPAQDNMVAPRVCACVEAAKGRMAEINPAQGAPKALIPSPTGTHHDEDDGDDDSCSHSH